MFVSKRANYRIKVEDIKANKTTSFSVHLEEEQINLLELRNIIMKSITNRK